MLVSVILTSYNQREYVREAVESVLAQTYSDWELIVVDNGSTDGSPDILKDYVRDRRVTLVEHAQNEAISRRFNQAIARSRGELISFLYSDDTYLPTKLAHQVELFRKLGPAFGVVYGPALRHNVHTGRSWRTPTISSSGYILEDMLARGLVDGTINMLSPMTRRRCFERHRFYDDVFAEGESIYYRVAMTERFHYDDEPLVVLREHLRNLGKATRFNVDTFEVVCERLAKAPEFPAACVPHLKQFRATLLRNGGWSVLRVGGDAKWATRAILRSLRLSPRSALNPRVAGALTLAMLPVAVRTRINALGHRLRDHRLNTVNVEVDRPVVEDSPSDHT